MFLTNFVFISDILFSCFGLSWLPIVPPSLRTRGLRRVREKPFLAVHGCTERKPARGYAKSWLRALNKGAGELLNRRKHPSLLRPATAWFGDMPLFWGKRAYDFFEAGRGAQRIP